jgi:hypothetical protein
MTTTQDNSKPLSNGELESKYGIYTYSRLKELPSEGCKFLVEDLIPPKQIGILVAEWGLGKSPLAIQLQVALGAGSKKFLGRFSVPPTPTRVLYADYENGRDPILEIQGRIAKFLDAPDLDKTYVFGANYSPVLGLNNLQGLEKMVKAVRDRRQLH